MADMFGSPLGRHVAEADMAKEAMLGPQMLHSVMQSAAVPSQIQQREAQSRYLGERANALKVDADVQRSVAAAAQSTEWTDEEKANPAWKFADLYRKAGDIKTAVKVAGTAASIDQRKASADANAARQALISVRTDLAHIDRLSRQVRSVDSSEALQSVLQQHEEATGQPTGMLQNGALDPRVAEQWETVRDNLQTQALTERDRLLNDYRERALKSANAERRSKQDNRTFWQDFTNQERKAAAQARGRGTKAGVNIFDKTEGARIGTEFISSQFGDINPNQAKVLGRGLAEKAKMLREANPALTPTEAIQEAFKAEDATGTYGGLTRRWGYQDLVW